MNARDYGRRSPPGFIAVVPLLVLVLAMVVVWALVP
jgi:hypothetical protein